MLRLIDDYFKYEEQIKECLYEYSFEDKIIPRRMKYNHESFYDYACELIECKTKVKEGLVTSSLYFLYDDVTNKVLGCVDIRHYLNEHLLNTGGHIGLSIRKSYRLKGYGTKLLKLSFEICKSLNIYKVLIVCENDISARVCKNLGGVLENEIIDKKGLLLKRYWVDLNN